MYLHLHLSVCKLVVMSKRKLLWYEIVRRKLGINLQLFKLLKTSKAFVLMGHFWLNNKLQANGECTLLFPAVRGDITSYCTVNSRHTFQYTAHWIVGAWLCISCRWGKHMLLKKSIEIIDWITGWVILPLESTCGLTLSGGYLKFVYSNETMPNPRAQVKALQIFTPSPHEKLYILCMNSHWFLLDQGKAMLKMLWNSSDQGRPETSCNYLWALLLPNSWCQNSSCVWDSFLADFVRIV